MSLNKITDISTLESFLESMHEHENKYNEALTKNHVQIRHLMKVNRTLAKRISNNMLHRNRIIERIAQLKKIP